MTRTGKIARLPHDLREQINRRIRDGHPGKDILDWLNSLPQVRALLQAEFENLPINLTNLGQWKNGGYRDWQIRQDALDFVNSLQEKDALGGKTLSATSTDNLIRWLTLQYAAATQSLDDAPDTLPGARWSRLREFANDIARLRRGDLSTERLRLQRELLALKQSNSEVQKEKQFWKWTKRRDVRQKLYPSPKRSSTDNLVANIDRLLALRKLAAAQTTTASQGQQGPSQPPVPAAPNEALPKPTKAIKTS